MSKTQSKQEMIRKIQYNCFYNSNQSVRDTTCSFYQSMLRETSEVLSACFSKKIIDQKLKFTKKFTSDPSEVGIISAVQDLNSLVKYCEEIKDPTKEELDGLYEIMYGQFDDHWEVKQELNLMKRLGIEYETKGVGLKGDIAKMFSRKKVEAVKYYMKKIGLVSKNWYFGIKKPKGREYQRDRKEKKIYYPMEVKVNDR